MDTVLYIDDEPINCYMFELNFSKSFHILLAESGMGGLKILEEDPLVRAIICDMKMPGMDGLEFIYKVKETKPELPCFILSGYNVSEDILMAMKKGVIVKYFQKPMDMGVIIDELKEVLKPE